MANLFAAKLNSTHLSKTYLFGSSLRYARLNKAYLVRIHLREANLARSQLNGATLLEANLESANFNYAVLKKTELSRAQLDGASFIRTEIEHANFTNASLVGVLMRGEHLLGLPARKARSSGKPIYLGGSNFTIANTKYLAVKNVDFSNVIGLTGNQLRQMFGDASVVLPPNFDRPCHWANVNLSLGIFSNPNDPFIGRWRGWVEANGGAWPTSPLFDNFKDVIAISPPPECPLIKDM